MKVRSKIYAKLIFDMFVSEPVQRLKKKARYGVELGGRGGYEVNGIGEYWGRFASVEKIVELATSLKWGNEDEWFSFYFPSPAHKLKFSHRISIHPSKMAGRVDVEFQECSDQSGSYFRELEIPELSEEIGNLHLIEKSPENFGYVRREH